MKGKSQGKAPVLWDEVFGPDGTPRELYRPLLDRVLSMPRSELRLIIERLEATMREMGVTFDVGRSRPWGQRPWFCDALPEIFAAEEWEHLADGMRQRLRAFELFLQDIHGPKEILRQHVIPAAPVLGSPYFQRPAVGLPRPGGDFLHLCGAALVRRQDGRMAVSHHYFSNASGISYMMQNRRALSRVFAESFHGRCVESIADVPVSLVEMFRRVAPPGVSEPVVALLTGGAGSPAYSEHTFLARRMGIPLVQGGDLLVLNDHLYLKSVSGLERIDVLYVRVPDAWLDSMVFRRDSLLGVSGLVQCVRRGTVSVVNAIGSRLADDRAILPFASRIIGFYLGETELLPTLRTWWLGDLDQRDHVLDHLDRFDIRPLYGEALVHHAASTDEDGKVLRRLLDAEPQNYVAQPRSAGAQTVCLDRRGALDERRQDHIVFALRRSAGEFEVLPGALTRVSLEDNGFTASELGGGSKDTWVLGGDSPTMPRSTLRTRSADVRVVSRVTSRVADCFYWLGRYLERAHNLAGMVGVVESLETEELNRAEQQLYRPVWNRILPPLEQPESGRKRSISTAVDRYRLTLDARENGSVINTLQQAVRNARQIQECLSVEALAVLNKLEGRLIRSRYRTQQDEAMLTIATQRLCSEVVSGLAEFFGTSEATMLSDRGWNFCRAGQQFERAVITCNAGLAIFKSLAQQMERSSSGLEHAVEIELSAFLRLLGSRDSYRQIYQMRAEPVPVLEMFYSSAQMPRSVLRCLRDFTRLLESGDDRSHGMLRTRESLSAVLALVEDRDWMEFLPGGLHGGEDSGSTLPDPIRLPCLIELLEAILGKTLAIHDVLTDGFINHQIQLS
ncbi:MAG: circularly permuted type 2 ATP-grasp protein [Verrucomicrobiota bacterium]